MKNLTYILPIACALCFFSCERKDDNEVASQQFIHKYGMTLSQKAWNEGSKDGQIIKHLKNGVTVTENYIGGVLHGNTTKTFPKSDYVEQLLVYDSGTLTKQVFYDEKQIPIYSESLDLDGRKTITRWDIKGAPLSIEVYENDKIISGEYFNQTNECESSVIQGNGERMHRDRELKLLNKDTFKDGILVHRVTYHDNGTIQSELSYENYQLHGKQMTYTDNHLPLIEANWDHGVLDGMQFIYTDGALTAEIPYNQGKKHGIERQYDTNKNLVAEIHWINDLRHGSTRLYGASDTQIDWYFAGKPVSLEKFQMLEFREKLMAEIEKPQETLEKKEVR
jgi:antitoxin component YwqK of YwqJK toxin-antitoxin module